VTKIKREMLATYSFQAVLMLAWGNMQIRARIKAEEERGRCEMELPVGFCNVVVCNRVADVCSIENENEYCYKCFEKYILPMSMSS
jgi:hypothetical protein